MKFTLRQLAYIESAAKHQSIAMAARESRISQSSISGAIDDFESAYSVQLFVRQPSKGLNLTSCGRALVDKISHLLRQVETVDAELLGVHEHVTGELNLGCFAPLAPLVLPSILRALTVRYPALSIRVHEGDLRYVNGLLEKGEADVILSYDLGLSEGVSFEKLGEARPHAIFNEAHPMAKSDRVSIQDLLSEPMILLDLPESRTYFDILFKTADALPKVVYRTETYETVRSFVSAGLGYSILNVRPAIDHAYTGNRVVCVPLDGPLPVPAVGIGVRPNDYLTRATREFVDECRTFFSHLDRDLLFVS